MLLIIVIDNSRRRQCETKLYQLQSPWVSCWERRPWALHRLRKTARPGQQMQDKGSVRGQPGASGYAPGHKMQDKGSKAGPRAFGVCAGSTGLDKWTGNPRRSEFRDFEDPLTVQKRSKRAAPPTRARA